MDSTFKKATSYNTVSDGKSSHAAPRSNQSPRPSRTPVRGGEGEADNPRGSSITELRDPYDGLGRDEALQDSALRDSDGAKKDEKFFDAFKRNRIRVLIFSCLSLRGVTTSRFVGQEK